MDKNKLTGIVLSGGRSLRMGTEKGLVQFNGIPLIEYAVAVLSELCSEILICSNNSAYEYLKHTIVPDVYSDCGPMGGIYSGLLASKNKYNLIIPCDVPYLNKELYVQLLEKACDNKAVIPSVNNELQPLCGVYSTDCLPLLKTLILQRKYKMILATEELDAAIVPILYKPTIFANINTPEEVSKLSPK